MNSHQTNRSPLTFILGLIIGLFLMGAFWLFFNSSMKAKEMSEIPPDHIDLKVAQDYYKNYTTGDSCQFKSLPFSRQQIKTISAILDSTQLNYFNFYKGVGSSLSDTVIIVVGVDSKGKEEQSAIYKVEKSKEGNSPCPPVCDHSILD